MGGRDGSSKISKGNIIICRWKEGKNKTEKRGVCVCVVETDIRWVGKSAKDAGNRVTYNIAGQYFREYKHKQCIRIGFILLFLFFTKICYNGFTN